MQSQTMQKFAPWKALRENLNFSGLFLINSDIFTEYDMNLHLHGKREHTASRQLWLCYEYCIKICFILVTS